MLRQRWTIFLFMTSFCVLHGQIIEDFSTPGGLLSSEWLGDRAQFVVTDRDVLQLHDVDSGAAQLFQETIWQQKMSWQLLVELDFDPSRNNRLDIYLYSDTTELKIANALVLRIGENGNNDAIILLNVIEGKEEVLARGLPGRVAKGPVDLRINVSFENGLFTIESDNTGDICFFEEFSIRHEGSSINEHFFFGWNCIYTSSRSDKFVFDDIYVGPKIADDQAPAVRSYSALDNMILLDFDELIDSNSLSNVVIELTPPNEVLLSNPSKNSLLLTSSSGYDHTVEHELYLSGLSDRSGNILDTIISIVIPRTAENKDLLINEVLFNPIGSGSDFVEIINHTSSYIALSNVLLENRTDNQKDHINDLVFIGPGALAVFTDNKNDITDRYDHHDRLVIYEISIPSFNNSDGNVSISSNDEIIDSFDYDEDLHHPLLDDVEGISLGRISLDSDSNDTENWTSSPERLGFASPGLQNGLGRSSSDNSFKIEDKVFTPNGDGDKDHLRINFELETSGYVCNMRIFNEYGKMIKTIVSNEILPANGTVHWDGRTQDGTVASMGIYILHVEIYSLTGQSEQFKLTFALGDFIN